MRLIHSVVPVTAVGALLLAACGSSSSTNALSGVSPKQATIQSLQKFSTTSVKYDLDGKVTVDSSKLQGISSDQLHQITGALGGAGGVTLTGTGEQESQKRSSVTLSVKPLVSQTVTAVTYDGEFFYSVDGGKTFGTGGSLSSLTGGFGVTPDQSQQLFSALPDGSYSDTGQTQMDGLTVEHYSAAITKDQLFQAISGASTSTGSQQQQNLALIQQFITAGTSSVDAYVRTDNGQLDRYTADINFGFDLGALVGAFAGLGSGSSSSTSGGAAPSGTLGIGLTLGVHLHDFGTPITITKPTADPNAPKLPSGLGGLFGG
jgi:hypothetical protein